MLRGIEKTKLVAKPMGRPFPLNIFKNMVTTPKCRTLKKKWFQSNISNSSCNITKNNFSLYNIKSIHYYYDFIMAFLIKIDLLEITFWNIL